MSAWSYKSRMSRLTDKNSILRIALSNVKIDIYNLYKYAMLAAINLHTQKG